MHSPGRLPLSVIAVLTVAAAVIFALECKTRGSAPPAPASAAPTTSAAPAPPKPTVAQRDEGRRTEDEKNTIDVFTHAAPATVFVTQKRVVVDYFAGKAQEVQAGSGSGFIWDDQGHVVTNYHVIRGAQSLTVTLHDHTSFDAEVRGVEPRKDIAVLKLVDPPKDLTPIRHPKKLKLEVGQKTIAIGNPFGLDHTLTTGVVSALGREVQGIGGVSIRDMIQTDAAINPGNSGGPLLDSAGQLIGMNTMIYSRSGASAGIGFAVPVGAVARVVPQIIRTGKAEQVGLGVQIDPAQRLERSAGIRGVAILRVIPGTPADKAGLKGITQSLRGISLGDVIVKINEESIDDYDDLYNTLDGFAADDKVKLTLMRDGKEVVVEVQLIKIQ